MRFILPIVLLCGTAISAALPQQDPAQDDGDAMLETDVAERVVAQQKPTAAAKTSPAAKAPAAKSTATKAHPAKTTAKTPPAKTTAKPSVAKKPTPVVTKKPTPVVTKRPTPIVAKKPTPVVAKKLVPTVHSHYDYHLKKVDAKGYSDVTFHQDGTVDFKVHMRESGALGYDYSISCALRDTGGQVYTLKHKGKVHGTFSPGSRNSDYHESKKHPQVAARWDKIVGAPPLHCRVHMDWDVGSLVDEVVKVVKTAGPIIGTVIALF